LPIPFKIAYVRRKGSRYKEELVDLKNVLRIPNAVMTFPPLMVLWRYLQGRFSKLEQT
jgi:hypothetical protein